MGERAAREIANQQLDDRLSKEGASREQQVAVVRDLCGNEQVARRAVENMIAEEKSERFKQQELLAQRLSAVQRSIGGRDRLHSNAESVDDADSCCGASTPSRFQWAIGAPSSPKAKLASFEAPCSPASLADSRGQC